MSRSSTLKKIDIFISSPRDVGEERQRAIEVIKDLNDLTSIKNRYVLKPLAYEREAPAAVGESAQQVVNHYMMEAEQSHIVVCILWQRMGTPVVHEETGERFPSGTEYEFITAYRANQERGLPRILLYRCMRGVGPDTDLEQLGKVQAFFKKFQGPNAEYRGMLKEYKTPDEFADMLYHDLDQLIAEFMPDDTAGDASPAALSQPARRDFYRHISLPANYVIRADLLAEVRTALLKDAHDIALTSAIKGKPTALHGMGGIGKTVMARALCDDERVQAAFPDGILWATLGQEPDISARMREWIHALGGTISEQAPSVDSLKDTLAKHLTDRACLLVVDDVWQKKAAEAFRVGGRCRLLLTTRDAELARDLGATVQPVPTTTVPEAVNLLDVWADGALDGTDPELKERIVNQVGRLPLAIKLAGAQFRRQQPETWIKTFDVRKLRSNRPEDLHDSLELTLRLSLDALSEENRRLYTAPSGRTNPSRISP